ncbi:YbaY family lipoprotein [Psychrilyobacter atlanticus]|uniref:YbaY family lipoprotein n=1 Tax=Psychrilyobacter atlanticus TaxID=271091 RepID=UPI0004246F56|nr:YbaY family lipoprotein [Psychrilyobacter atlanticus]
MKKIILIALSILTLVSCNLDKEKKSSINITATYRERIALLPGAKVIAILEDVSKADAPSIEVVKQEIPAGNLPYKLTIDFPKKDIIETHRYNVRVKIMKDEKLLFTSTDSYDPFKEDEKVIILKKMK